MAIKTYKKTDKTKLSKNFCADEFRCGLGRGCNCATTLIDEKLVEILQKIRDHFGKPVAITSGYRCPTYNKSVGGATGSYHSKGMAADIVVQGVAPAEVAKYAESIGILGIGLYEKKDCGDDFVHIDTRATKSFWYGHDEEPRSTFGGIKTVKVKVEVRQLSVGCTGDDVRALQILLIGMGYSCGKYGADGDFGADTKKAVIAFQKANGLTQDGIVGAKTWAALLG